MAKAMCVILSLVFLALGILGLTGWIQMFASNQTYVSIGEIILGGLGLIVGVYARSGGNDRQRKQNNQQVKQNYEQQRKNNDQLKKENDQNRKDNDQQRDENYDQQRKEIDRQRKVIDQQKKGNS